jgi:hypothetical protein
MSSTLRKNISIEEALVHPNKVRVARFREDEPTELGYSTGNVTIFSPELYNINSNGLTPNGGGSIKLNWSSAERASLESGGTYTFKLTSDILENSLGSTEYCMGTGESWIEIKQINGKTRFFNRWNNTSPR